MTDFVVVDASVVTKWLVDEDDSDKAHALLEAWDSAGMRPTAPGFLPAEVTDALHRRVVRSDLPVEEAAVLLARLASRVELQEPSGIHGRALELASELGQGAAYDCHYLALAEALDCELWTADERFHRAASAAFPFVHALSEVESPG